MKVSELEGVELDFWVGRSLGGRVEKFYSGQNEYDGFKPTSDFPDLENFGMSFCRLHMNPETMDGFDYSFHPTVSWDQGGPLIQRYEIAITPVMGGTWEAGWNEATGGDDYEERAITGPTPLVAAMRAVVAMRFGSEVSE